MVLTSLLYAGLRLWSITGMPLRFFSEEILPAGFLPFDQISLFL